MPRDDPPTPSSPESPTPAAVGVAAAAPKQIPLSPRQEAFCQHFVLLGNAANAALKAGYAMESASNQGYRLMRQPLIQARVAVIRAGLARAYCLDSSVLLGKLEAVYQRAVYDRSFHAAARCVEIQARIAGHVGTTTRGEKRSDRDTKKTMTTNDNNSAPIPEVNLSESKD